MKTLTKDKERVIRYLQKWQGILGLDGWQLCTLFVPTQPADQPDLSMRVEWPTYYKSADIKIFPHNRENHDTVVERTVVHELCHLIFAPVDDVLHTMIGCDSEVNKRYSDQLEGCVDHLAVMLHKAVTEEV